MIKRFAITTENGKLTCPELAGYELPELPEHQEDDVEGMAENEYREYPSDPKGSNFQNNRDINCHRKRKAFIKGYLKAREKFEFMRQDLIDLVQAIKDYTYESGGVFGYDEREASEFVDIFLNGRNRTPIAIEVDMAKPSESFGAFVGNVIGEFVPATNPDGTVKGRWVYE